MGNTPIVTIHDSPTIYATFLKDGEAYTGRHLTDAGALARNGRNGVILVDGDLWREHRRFTLHVLRDFGLGKNLMQERILDEVTHTIADIKQDLKNGAKVLSIQNELDRAVGSIINLLLFGYRFGRDKLEKFEKNKQGVHKVLMHGGTFWWKIIEINVNLMKHLPHLRNVYQKVVNDNEELGKFYLEEIENHKKTIDFDSDQEPTDYVEAFLRHRHKLEKSGIKDHTYTDNQLFGMIFDLWLAGQETTATTLSWMCIYLIRHPECQIKMQQELDKFIGSDRIVTLDDKNNLNYVNAVVAETQRYCSLVPFNVPHKTTKDVEIHGYKIPSGTVITHQVGTVMADNRYFKNPDKFDPERFLDKNGKFFSPPELMPFGIGKRACLGEGLARMELYLFAANIFNQFKLKAAYGQIPSEHRIMRGTASCLPYQCEIETRF
uniref:Cytochrome P450 n=1 Tax=Panagrolaimus sp. JU765 TaxID=591449 RepID=A0AC34QCE1_9BILA